MYAVQEGMQVAIKNFDGDTMQAPAVKKLKL
jgi:hypothetical protein